MSDLGMSRPTDLLSQMLGPQGPELTCEECFGDLNRYVELELAGHDADTAVLGMRAHQGVPGLPRGRRQPRGTVASEPRP
jgi:hypothetical protein